MQQPGKGLQRRARARCYLLGDHAERCWRATLMSWTTKALGLIATLWVLALGQAWGATAPSAAPTPDRSSGDKTQEVTILGRLELQRRVTRFVDRIAVLENEEGLPRWNTPVCPLEWGLQRQAGEFVVR